VEYSTLPDAGSGCLRLRDFELFADAAYGAFFDFTVTRHAGYLPVGRIEPHRVRTALSEEGASLPAQMLLQVAKLMCREVSYLD
jgi:hypothetical protein